MYDEKRIQEIINEFQKVLVVADNFTESNNSRQALKEYRKMWASFRGTGANMLGLVNFLLDVENKKHSYWGSATVDME